MRTYAELLKTSIKDFTPDENDYAVMELAEHSKRTAYISVVNQVKETINHYVSRPMNIYDAY